jgi:hypothetical protein
MIQIIMLGVGIYYLYQLTQLGRAGFNLGLSPDLLYQWRAQRRQQYLWGIVAGWGSLIGSIVALVAVMAMTQRCYYGYCASDDDAAAVWMIVVTLVLLVGGIVLSLVARNKAIAIERLGRPYGYGAPMWGQPAQPAWGQLAQPAWGQPPAQPAWGQPPAQPAWGQPPAQAPSAGPPAVQPPSAGEPADSSGPNPPTGQ